MQSLKNMLFLSPWLQRLIRILLGGVFVWAGTVKLMDPRAFARSISAYGLLPESLLVPVAIGLPVLELLAGSGLVLDVRGSLKAILGLLVLFLGVLSFALWNHLDVDCGCFTPEEIHARNSLWWALFRDLGLMGMVLYIFLWRRIRVRLADGCGSQYTWTNDDREDFAQ